MYGSFLLLHDEFLHVVAITFTALVVTELVMVGLTIRTWHWLMVVAELGSIAIYIASLGILTQYFGEAVWRCLPLWLVQSARESTLGCSGHSPVYRLGGYCTSQYVHSSPSHSLPHFPPPLNLFPPPRSTQLSLIPSHSPLYPNSHSVYFPPSCSPLTPSYSPPHPLLPYSFLRSTVSPDIWLCLEDPSGDLP